MAEHHTVICSSPTLPDWMWERIKKVELTGWDRNIYSDGEKKKDNSYDFIYIYICIYMHVYTKWCTSNCSLPTDQCWASLPSSIKELEWTPSLFKTLSIWCHMIWNIPLTSLAAVLVLSQLLRLFDENGLGSVWHCLTAAINISVLSTLFSSQNQNIIPDTPKKPILSQLKLRQLLSL